MIQSFAAEATKLDAYETALYIAQHAGLLKELHSDDSVEGRARYENIQELLNGIKEFSEREDIEDRSLAIFMQDVALLTNDDNDKNKDKDTVSLMTIHSAKGLEFKNVFVVGLEENLFPSQMSLTSRTDLEEERRLFYRRQFWYRTKNVDTTTRFCAENKQHCCANTIHYDSPKND